MHALVKTHNVRKEIDVYIQYTYNIYKIAGFLISVKYGLYCICNTHTQTSYNINIKTFAGYTKLLLTKQINIT